MTQPHALHPEPGDVIVLHSDEPLTTGEAEQQLTTLRSAFPDHVCLVIDGTARLAAMNRNDMRDLLESVGIVSITRRITTPTDDRLDVTIITGTPTRHH